MPESFDLPSGATAEFVTPDELSFRQEEALRRGATALHMERVRLAAERGIPAEKLPTYPTQEEMMAIDLIPLERAAAGALCRSWSHPQHPPSADPAHVDWMDDAPRADVRAVLSHAMLLLPVMTGTEEVAGVPFDSSTSSTSSTPTSEASPTPETPPPSEPGDLSPSPAGPSPSSTPLLPGEPPTSS